MVLDSGACLFSHGPLQSGKDRITSLPPSLSSLSLSFCLARGSFCYSALPKNTRYSCSTRHFFLFLWAFSIHCAVPVSVQWFLILHYLKMSLWGKGHFLWALRTQCTAPIPVLPETGGPCAAQSIFCEPCTLPTSTQLWFLPGPTSNTSSPWGTGHFLWALSIHCTAPTSTQLWFLPSPTWNMSSPWGTAQFL